MGSNIVRTGRDIAKNRGELCGEIGQNSEWCQHPFKQRYSLLSYLMYLLHQYYRLTAQLDSPPVNKGCRSNLVVDNLF